MNGKTEREYLLAAIETSISKNILFYDRMVPDGLTLELISLIDLFVKIDFEYSEPNDNDIRKQSRLSDNIIDRSVKKLYVPREVFDKFIKSYCQSEDFIPSTVTKDEIFVGNYSICLNKHYYECLDRYISLGGYLFRKYLLIADCETFDIHSFIIASCD